MAPASYNRSLLLNRSTAVAIYYRCASRSSFLLPELIYFQSSAAKWIRSLFVHRSFPGWRFDSSYRPRPDRCRYFHIRQLRAIRRSLTTESTQALVRAFVHSRLDNCNGALAGLPGYAYKRLQAVLRSAARLCLRLPSFASVSDAMRRDLHWLNFPNRVTYKLAVQWLICVNMKWPRCISEDTACRQ